MKFFRKKNSDKLDSILGLAFCEGDGAPRISFRGLAVQSDEICKIAEQYGVPIIEDPVLASVLEQLNVDEEISPDMYEAVATILSRLDSFQS